MKTEITEIRPPKGATNTEPREGKYPRTEIAAFIVLLVLAFLAGGAWASAQAAENGASAKDVPPAQTGDLPAARPHPRGLPRPKGRPHPRRQDRERVPRTVGPPQEAGRRDGSGHHARSGGARA